jgi:hypothetical protein
MGCEYGYMVDMGVGSVLGYPYPYPYPQPSDRWIPMGFQMNVLGVLGQSSPVFFGTDITPYFGLYSLMLTNFS